MPSPGSVTARALTKAFGAQRALTGLDLDVRPGTVHGLLGPNGAGKTTLLRAVLGLVRPDSGELCVTGRVGGFVEVPGAYGYLSGRQNLELLARLDDEPGDVDEVLRRVGLADRAGTRVRGWSLGMRQRLGIAAGLLRRPGLLVLDEPANGLDPLGARALRVLVRELAADGLTVLLCSHDLAEVDAVCDEVTVVLAGRTRWTGPVAALRSRPGQVLLATSDDTSAASVVLPGVAVRPLAQGGLAVTARVADLDAYVLALAARGVAVRSLERQAVALEQAFLELVT